MTIYKRELRLYMEDSPRKTIWRG